MSDINLSYNNKRINQIRLKCICIIRSKHFTLKDIRCNWKGNWTERSSQTSIILGRVLVSWHIKVKFVVNVNANAVFRHHRRISCFVCRSILKKLFHSPVVYWNKGRWWKKMKSFTSDQVHRTKILSVAPFLHDSSYQVRSIVRPSIWTVNEVLSRYLQNSFYNFVLILISWIFLKQYYIRLTE